jgi:catechol 2,3-dioxygenase-like lactoylglutathione lyase family enzyme
MAIQLDHLIVPSHDPVEGAKSLAGLLDVPWQEAQGPFTPVYVNETITLDFADREQFEPHHYCFRVSEAEFDAILGRIEAAQIPYRSSPLGETDMQINRRLGGKNLYWQDTDGHLWEILTVSYARPESPPLITAGRTPTAP